MKKSQLRKIIKEVIKEQLATPNKTTSLPPKVPCPYWSEATELGLNTGSKSQMEIVFNNWQDPISVGYTDAEYFHDMICAENDPVHGPGVCQSHADGTIGFISLIAYCGCCDNFPSIFNTGYGGGTATPNKKLPSKNIKK